MTERKRRDMETGAALLAWSASLDTELAKAGAISGHNREVAVAMIDAAKTEALLTHPRGGHRSSSRRALMPWELARESHLAELIEAALRGRLRRRTGELARASA